MFLVSLTAKLILSLLGIIIFIFILLITIPLNYIINAEYDQGMVASIRIKWAKLIGISSTYDTKVGFLAKIVVFNKEIAINHQKKKDSKKIKKKKEKEVSLNKKKIIFNTKKIMDKNFITEIASYMKRLIRIIKPESLSIKLIYGFDDPFITGYISSLICCLEEILHHGDFDIQPVFTREILYARTNIEGKVAIGAILIESVKLFLKKEVRNILINSRKTETFG